MNNNTHLPEFPPSDLIDDSPTATAESCRRKQVGYISSDTSLNNWVKFVEYLKSQNNE